MSMASRMAVMSAGRIAQVGAPAEVYETPASRFVADFIGAVNLLEGRVAAAEQGFLRIECGALGGTVLAEGDPALVGRAVTVAVRPEKIELAPAGAENRFQGEVRNVAYRGEASTLHVALGASGPVFRVSLGNRRRGGAPAATVGDAVTIGWTARSTLVLTQ